MNLRHLRYFTTIVEEQNIGRAAVRLNMSQPPLTRQIRQLEAEMGVQLLTRSAKGVQPTNAGLILFEEAQNILTLVGRAEARTRMAGQGQLGRLDIGVIGSIVLAMPGLLLNVRKRLPQVEITLQTMNKKQQIEALRERRLTVGFSFLAAPDSELVSKVVRREHVVAAVHIHDDLAAKRAVTLRELTKRPLILYTSGSRPNLADVITALFRREDLQPQIAQEVVDSLLSAVALVAAGFGTCLVPEWVASLNLAGVKFIPLRHAPKTTIDLYATYRRDDSSTVLQAFLASFGGRRTRP